MQTKQENELQIKNDIGTAGYVRTVGEDGKSYRTGITPLIDGAIGDVEQEISDLQTTVGEHTTDIQNLSDDVSDLQTLTSTHTTDISDVKEDLTLKADLPTETIENASIASFTDGAEDVPVKELKVAIEPIQSGSGDPSPTNVRPISGRDSVTVTRTGVNVWDEEWEVGGFNVNTGEKSTDSSRMRSKNLIPVLSGQQYYFNLNYAVGSYGFYMFRYDANKNYLGYAVNYNNLQTIPDDTRYINFVTQPTYGTTYNNDISINYPSTDHDYHSGADNTSYPIPLSSTIYGGTLEVDTGVLTVDRAMVDLGSLNWARYNFSGVYAFYVSLPTKTSGSAAWGICERYKVVPWTSPVSLLDGQMDIQSNTTYLYVRDDSCSDVETFKSVNDGTKFVYSLATPTTVHLTPAQVTTLLKDNNIFADSGNIVKLIYRADLGAYIEKLINA